MLPEAASTLVSQFLAKGDFSKTAARRLDGELSALRAPASAEFEELLDLLAAYSPEGGEFLCDEPRLTNALQRSIQP